MDPPQGSIIYTTGIQKSRISGFYVILCFKIFHIMPYYTLQQWGFRFSDHACQGSLKCEASTSPSSRARAATQNPSSSQPGETRKIQARSLLAAEVSKPYPVGVHVAPEGGSPFLDPPSGLGIWSITGKSMAHSVGSGFAKGLSPLRPF